MKTSTVFILFLGLISASAVNAEWQQIFENEEKEVFYVDFSRVKKHRNIVTFWQISQSKSDPSSGSTLVKRVFDCENELHTSLHVFYYSQPMAKGKVLAEAPMNAPWVPIVPGPENDVLLNAICNK